MNKSIEFVELLLKQPKIDVNCQNEIFKIYFYGFSILYIFIRNSLNYFYATPLHYAVFNQVEKAVQLLINHSGIDPNIKENIF